MQDYWAISLSLLPPQIYSCNPTPGYAEQATYSFHGLHKAEKLLFGNESILVTCPVTAQPYTLVIPCTSLLRSPFSSVAGNNQIGPTVVSFLTNSLNRSAGALNDNANGA